MPVRGPIVLPEGFNELAMGRGGPMLFNRFDRYVGGSLARYGEFSPGELAAFRQIVPEGGVVAEVGANIGRTPSHCRGWWVPPVSWSLEPPVFGSVRRSRSAVASRPALPAADRGNATARRNRRPG